MGLTAEERVMFYTLSLSQRSEGCFTHYPGNICALAAKVVHIGKVAIEGKFMVLKSDEFLLRKESLIYSSECRSTKT